MAPFHNNKLNIVGLFDEDDSTAAQVSEKASMSIYGSTAEFGNCAYNHAMDPFGSHAVPANSVQMGNGSNDPVSSIPTYDSDYAESDQDDRRPSKKPKINKDGAPRKPRQPRPKLLKWTDDDWKNALLGIIWACGENGIQIPFDQAAQIVGEKCTAGALQQAVLKLRCKQIDEGHQIPALKMAWTRKNKNSLSSSGANDTTQQVNAFTNAVKKSTKMQGIQSLIVTLKCAYPHTDKAPVVRDSCKKKSMGVVHMEHPLPSSIPSMVSAQPSGGFSAYTTATSPSDGCDGDQKHLDEYIPGAFEYTNILKNNASDTAPLLGEQWLPEHDQGYNQADNDGIDTLTVDSQEWYPAVAYQPVSCVGGSLHDMSNAGLAYDPFYSEGQGVLQGHPQQAPSLPSHLDFGNYPDFSSYEDFANNDFANDDYAQGNAAELFKFQPSDFDYGTCYSD
ncbi:hypothetical protein P3342_002841 [Pyrenophora teres f. teres]|nr:hypothetical protein P3342_002841 [Pyrenophora teres f. teres]